MGIVRYKRQYCITGKEQLTTSFKLLAGFTLLQVEMTNVLGSRAYTVCVHKPKFEATDRGTVSVRGAVTMVTGVR